MSRLRSVWRIVTSWYVAVVVAAAAGIAIGYFVFFGLYPGKPKIGVIDIPFTVFTDDAAFVISSFLEYARERDDIKGVFVRLDSPGGFAAASEQLYVETRKLREKKPVVFVAHDFLASGAYMMSLGSNYTYARAGSNVGSVGVFAGLPPLLPSRPEEDIVRTGPSKFLGSPRRLVLQRVEQLKEGFAEMVVTERGDRLRISREEMLQANIYTGIEGVRRGLVDAIGGDTEAIEKVADLAGISDYELVDVNTEVSRIFFEKLRRIIEPLLDEPGNGPEFADIRALMAPMPSRAKGTGDSASPLGGVTGIQMLRRFFLPTGIQEVEAEAPQGASLKVNMPRFYYLYVEPSQ